jgi:hypothetical protein
MTISASARGLKPGVCTSSNRPATPYDGMMIYETDTNLVRIWNGTAWKTLAYSDYTKGTVLQVVNAFTSTSTSTTGSSYVNTSLTASITPTSTSSDVLILVSVAQLITTSNAGSSSALLVRGNASSRLADLANSTIFTNPTQDLRVPFTTHGYDTPSTTSSVQYSLLIASPESASNTATVNGAQRMILMEIAG